MSPHEWIDDKARAKPTVEVARVVARELGNAPEVARFAAALAEQFALLQEAQRMSFDTTSLRTHVADFTKIAGDAARIVGRMSAEDWSVIRQGLALRIADPYRVLPSDIEDSLPWILDVLAAHSGAALEESQRRPELESQFLAVAADLFDQMVPAGARGPKAMTAIRNRILAALLPHVDVAERINGARRRR